MAFILNNYIPRLNCNAKLENILTIESSLSEKGRSDPTVTSLANLISKDFGSVESELQTLVENAENPDFPGVKWFKDIEKKTDLYKINNNPEVLNYVFVEKGEDNKVSRVFMHIFTDEYASNFKKNQQKIQESAPHQLESSN